MPPDLNNKDLDLRSKSDVPDQSQRGMVTIMQANRRGPHSGQITSEYKACVKHVISLLTTLSLRCKPRPRKWAQELKNWTFEVSFC